MTAPELIDTHAHLYLEEFSRDISEVISRASQEGVTRAFLPALDSLHYPEMFRLEELYPGRCVAMAGIHPCYVKENHANELEFLRNLLTTRKFAAIGEIGLDYYWDTTFQNGQKLVFAVQLDLAREYDLPVVIHSRSAMEDSISTLRDRKGPGLKGIFHCFSGTLQNAEDIIDCGLYLGIGGVVTYKNAGLAEVVARIPLENLVLETDAPYLAPVPFRGKRNESSYLSYIVKKIAEVKKIDINTVAEITTRNARSVFEANQSRL